MDWTSVDLPGILAGAAVAGVIAWAGWVTRFVIGHNRACHAAANQEIARLRSELEAAKIESRRIADNVHDLRGQVSPVALWFQLAGEGRWGDPRQFGIQPGEGGAPARPIERGSSE